MKSKKKGFELAKPMNMVQMSWSKGITPMQIKAVHVFTMKLKKWIMDTGFKPNVEHGEGLDSYRGIKTSFEMTLEEFASITQTTKRALKTPVKDDEGNVVMYKGFPRLRIVDYFDEAQKIRCQINSQYITGSLSPLPSAFYDKETEMIRLGTSMEMAAILQDEAFAKNLSFVDMQLQLSLNSVMASHILDRISRFKTIKKDYDCTVGDFVEQCGIDEITMSNRSNFIMVNLKRPLDQIEKKSNGVWERIGSGVTVTAKKRGTLLKEDVITFKMKYNEPKVKTEAEIADDKVKQTASVLRESSDLIHGAIQGDQNCLNNPEFTLELVGEVLSMATSANGGDESLTKAFESAVLNTNEVITLCGQAMMMLMGMQKPDSFHAHKSEK